MTEGADPPPRARGFTSTEKLFGIAAGSKAPFVSSLAASYLLRTETDPQRRRELEQLRRACARRESD